MDLALPNPRFARFVAVTGAINLSRMVLNYDRPKLERFPGAPSTSR
jgi:hypothetical protein